MNRKKPIIKTKFLVGGIVFLLLLGLGAFAFLYIKDLKCSSNKTVKISQCESDEETITRITISEWDFRGGSFGIDVNDGDKILYKFNDYTDNPQLTQAGHVDSSATFCIKPDVYKGTDGRECFMELSKMIDTNLEAQGGKIIVGDRIYLVTATQQLSYYTESDLKTINNVRESLMIPANYSPVYN